MPDDFDFSEFSELDRDLVRLANSTMPKESKKFIRAEGNKLKRVTSKRAKKDVKVGIKSKKTEKKNVSYHKGIKRGKVYKYHGNDAWAIRVYGSAPHSHLIEYGHRMVGHKPDKKELGFVKGKYVFENSRKEFEKTYVRDVGKFVDNVIVKGLTK